MDSRSQNNSGIKDVWVDGSALGNGQSGSRPGIGVYWGPNDPSNVSEPGSGRPTNNSAEIEAATRAITDAGRMGYRQIRINTDSEILKRAATEWMPKWKQNDWHKSDGRPVVNREDFQKLDRAMNNNPNMDIRFKHVSGHSGNPNNDAADRLAKQGAQHYNSNRRY